MASNVPNENESTDFRNICAICLETLQDPRQVPCSHKFCSSCLKGYLEKALSPNTNDKISFPCPLCRQDIDIDTNGELQIEDIVEKCDLLSFSKVVGETESRADFQKSPVVLCESCARGDISNKAAKFCNECSEHICEECINFHKRNKLSSSHTYRDIEVEQKAPAPRHQWSGTCSKHGGKPYEYVCKGHGDMNCYKCIISNHRNCEILTLDEYLGSPCYHRKLQFIEKSLGTCESTLRQCTAKKLEYLEYLEQTSVQFDEEFETAKQIVIQTIKEAFDSFRSKFRTNVETLRKDTEREQFEIESDLHHFAECRQKLDNIRDGQLNPVVASNQLQDIVLTKNVEMQNRDETINHAFCWKFEPNTADIRDKLTKSYFFHMNRSNINLIKYAEFTSEDVIKKTTPCYRECAFLCDKYIICTDETSKVLRLFNIATESEISYISLTNQPYGIVAISENEFAVTFPSEKCIQIFDIKVDENTNNVTSKLVRTIKTEQEMYGIRSYTIGPNKRGIISVCKTTGSIVFYAIEGRVLETIHLKLPESKAPYRGWHLLAYADYFTVDDSNNQIYFTCKTWNSIYCFSFDGKLVYVHEPPNSTLKTPLGIAVGPNGNIFVSCHGNGRIQRLTKTGILKETFDLKSLRAPTFLVFNSDYSKCAVGDFNGRPKIHLYKVDQSCRVCK